MASTLKVDNLQTQDGDSYNVVSWDTTAKTTAFTAVSGKGYFVDTSSAAITVTLPASPSAGDIVSISDYNGSFGTNNCTVGRNSSNINGEASDWLIRVNDTSITFVYVDATEGWKVTNTSLPSDTNPFIIASGGTETVCGDYRIHTFTGPGTFTVSSISADPARNDVDYLVVAGGGSGGSNLGGGGGAGGFRESSGTASGCYTASPLGACVSALPVTAQAYPITVGAGGASVTGTSLGNPGSNSIFNTITSSGGGGGACQSDAGGDGGSGGGAGGNGGTAGNGNTPPVSPPQGNNGGEDTTYGGGGGGGAGAVGGSSTPSTGGSGGDGVTTLISATPTTYAGGGGGMANGPGDGSGGAGGGGAANEDGPATAGTTNTGGGGGGTRSSHNSGAGGSGIVIIRYKYQ